MDGLPPPMVRIPTAGIRGPAGPTARYSVQGPAFEVPTQTLHMATQAAPSPRLSLQPFCLEAPFMDRMATQPLDRGEPNLVGPPPLERRFSQPLPTMMFSRQTTQPVEMQSASAPPVQTGRFSMVQQGVPTPGKLAPTKVSGFREGERIHVYSETRGQWLLGRVVKAANQPIMVQQHEIPKGALQVMSPAGVKWVPPHLTDSVLGKLHANTAGRVEELGDFTPYASKYGIHPQAFVFDKDGSQVADTGPETPSRRLELIRRGFPYKLRAPDVHNLLGEGALEEYELHDMIAHGAVEQHQIVQQQGTPMAIDLTPHGCQPQFGFMLPGSSLTPIFTRSPSSPPGLGVMDVQTHPSMMSQPEFMPVSASATPGVARLPSSPLDLGAMAMQPRPSLRRIMSQQQLPLPPLSAFGL
mmetsp:Transcript_91963/g.259803  ORF Transcript_91963/g.259803 Transcript_91963/m.259803 type:complete len:412 (-) Transcript_91963:9-1244(-)